MKSTGCILLRKKIVESFNSFNRVVEEHTGRQGCSMDMMDKRYTPDSQVLQAAAHAAVVADVVLSD